MSLRGKFYSKLVVFSALFASTLATAEQKMPRLRNDMDRVKLLVNIQRYIPSLLSLKNDQYQIAPNLFNYLDNADQITRDLEKTKGYEELLEARGPEVVITIKGKSTDGLVREVNVGKLDDLKANWVKALDGVKGKGDAKTELAAAIAKPQAQKGDQKGTAQGFLVGLINSLPPKARGAVFKAPYEEQVAMLRKSLPEDIIAAGFKAENFGIVAEKISPAQALEMLAERKRAEGGNDNLLSLQAVLDMTGKSGMSIDDLKKEIPKWGEKTLGGMLKGDPVRTMVDQLSNDFPEMAQPKGPVERVERQLKDLFPTRKVEVQGNSRKVPTLYLREAPPWVGILRGCAGGDCSTSYSSAYGVSPTDRIFIVDDANGDLKGYAHGVLVNVDGRRNLFIHTIAGPRISADDTMQILQGLTEVKDRLGVEEVSLSNGGGGRINYNNIVQVFQKLSQQNPGKAIRMIDGGVRDVVNGKSSMNYDKGNDWGQAHKVRIPKDEELALDTEIRVAEEAALAKDVTKGDALLLANDLYALNRKELAERVQQAAGLSRKEIQEVQSIMDNTAGLNVKNYWKSVEDFFADLDVKVDKEFIRNKEAFFLKGFLNAPDAMQGANVAQATDYAIKLMESGQANAGRDFVRKNGKELLQQPRFQNYVRRKIADPNTNLAQFAANVLGGDPDHIIAKSLIMDWMSAEKKDSIAAGRRAQGYFGANGGGHAALVEGLMRDLRRRIDAKEVPFDQSLVRERLAEMGYQQDWLDQHMPEKPKENEPLRAGIHLLEGDTVLTPNKTRLAVTGVVERGSRVSTYTVQNDKKETHTLKIANSAEAKPLEKIGNEVSRTGEYRELGIPHLPISESSEWFLLKEHIEGQDGDAWLKDKNRSQESMDSLGDFLGDLAEKGLYVGHLEPHDMMFDGRTWRVKQSGSIERELTHEKASERYIGKFADRWGKDVKKAVPDRIKEFHEAAKNKIAEAKAAEAKVLEAEVKEAAEEPVAKEESKVVVEAKPEKGKPKPKTKTKTKTKPVVEEEPEMDILDLLFGKNDEKGGKDKADGKEKSLKDTVKEWLGDLNDADADKKAEKKAERPRREGTPIETNRRFNVGDLIQTPEGRVLQVTRIVDKGSKTTDYIVKDEEQRPYLLRIATDDEKAPARIEKDSARLDSYANNDVPHLDKVEAGDNFILQAYGENTQNARQVLKDKEANIERVELLRDFFRTLVEAGVYVGHLEPKDVIWDGEGWKVAESGSLVTQLQPQQALAQYQEKMPDRWGRNVATSVLQGCERALNQLAD